jgi:hypothetical protein
MNQITWSEDALKQAAAAVRQSMLDAMPPPSQCTHEFSSDHQAKMDRLFTRARRRERTRKVLQRAAMFFLAVLASVGVWLSVDTGARAAFFSWVQEIYENSIVYRFFGDPTAEELPDYHITWLPEGYEAVDVFNGKDLVSIRYQNGDDITSGFTFEYSFTRNNNYLALMTGDTQYIQKAIMVNGVHADFYQSSDPTKTNNMLWIDEDAGIVLSINGFVDDFVMLRMAKSIICAN